MHLLLDTYTWQLDVHQIFHSVHFSSVYIIHPQMQFLVLNICVFHRGTMCIIVKYLDACKHWDKYLEVQVHFIVIFYFRWDWISISRKTCFSTRPPTSSDLNITFIATINLLLFSLARYTRPNFPRPNEAPSSKSSFFHS